MVALMIAFACLLTSELPLPAAEKTRDAAPAAPMRAEPEIPVGSCNSAERYQNQWVVIAFGDRNPDKAIALQRKTSAPTQVVNSSCLKLLNPGWYIGVVDAATTEERAKQLVEKWKTQKLKGVYARLAGELTPSDRLPWVRLSKYQFEELSQQADALVEPRGTRVSFVEEPHDDPNHARIVVEHNGVGVPVPGKTYGVWEETFVLWSDDQRLFAFVSQDLYSGASDYGLVIADPARARALFFDLHQDSTWTGTGRDNVRLVDVGFVGHGIVARLEANYMCGSGHPGIDDNNEGRLGDKFCRDDPKDVGYVYVGWRAP